VIIDQVVEWSGDAWRRAMGMLRKLLLAADPGLRKLLDEVVAGKDDI
jgi:hypothetical protein